MSFTKTIALLCLIPLLAGCGSLPESIPQSPALALTPSTTPDLLGYMTAPSTACLVANWSSIQTNRLQGDLLAWHPDGQRLAYLAPLDSTGWYTGSVSVASGAQFEQHDSLAPNVRALGDLTWSPDGSAFAFINLRIDESLETISIINVDGSGLTDLFPFQQAQSDVRTSQKAIFDWPELNRLRVVVSCGDDCQQRMEISLGTGEMRAIGNTQRRNHQRPLDLTIEPGEIKTLDGLEPERRVLEYDPTVFPRRFYSPNWSPDETRVLYLDQRGLLWLLDVSEKTQYLLDIGLRIVNETKWSPDGSRVAVRAEDRIYVFETPCIKK